MASVNTWCMIFNVNIVRDDCDNIYDVIFGTKMGYCYHCSKMLICHNQLLNCNSL